MTAPIDDAHFAGLPVPRRYWAIAVLQITLVLVVLDSAIANIALPSIAISLKASPSDTVWVVSSYQMAVLVALLPCGALGEIFGPRRVYLAGVALFTSASAACALADSLPMLIAARFVQGLGGGAIMALAAMNLRFAVPHRLLGTIIGINAMTVAISSAAGPVSPARSWRWRIGPGCSPSTFRLASSSWCLVACWRRPKVSIASFTWRRWAPIP